jgi:hypothetical protein
MLQDFTNLYLLCNTAIYASTIDIIISILQEENIFVQPNGKQCLFDIIFEIDQTPHLNIIDFASHLYCSLSNCHRTTSKYFYSPEIHAASHLFVGSKIIWHIYQLYSLQMQS